MDMEIEKTQKSHQLDGDLKSLLDFIHEIRIDSNSNRSYSSYG